MQEAGPPLFGTEIPSLTPPAFVVKTNAATPRSRLHSPQLPITRANKDEENTYMIHLCPGTVGSLATMVLASRDLASYRDMMCIKHHEYAHYASPEGKLTTEVPGRLPTRAWLENELLQWLAPFRVVPPVIFTRKKA